MTTSTSTGGSWLTSPDNGCCYNTPTAVSVVVNPIVTLAVGTYTGQVVFTSTSGNVSLTVPVTLTIAPATGAAYFDNFPGQMSFAMKTGNTTITGQSVQVRNGGSGTLNWTLAGSTSDGGNWLTFTPASGTAPAVVNVGVTVANLPGGGLTAGTFIGMLTFTNSGGNYTVPVSVVVGANTLQQINPISFTKYFGAPNPLPQTLMVTSTGTVLAFGVVTNTANGGGWFTSPDDGCCANTPNTVTVVVSAPVTMPVGAYTGQVVLRVTNGSVAITVPVTLTVAPAPPNSAFPDNLPGQLSFTMVTGGTSITPQTIQIRNGGDGLLNWILAESTSDAGPWLNISSSSGTAPSQVTVSVSPVHLPNAGLIAGTFVGQLLLQTAGGNVTIPVSVTVGSSVFTQVNGINFTKAFNGANPLPQTLIIASTGSVLAFSVTSSTATGGAWLSVPDDGCCANTPNTVTAIVNAPATMPVGTYTGQIVIAQSNGAQSITVPVTLSVAPSTNAAFFDNLPGQVSFTMVTGSTNDPPAQSIQIRNGGSGTLSWNLSTSTADGGNWLSASAATGTAPSIVNIAIHHANLPNLGLVAGTFIGEVVLQSAGNGSVTIPVTVVVGANVFQQVNAINFTMPQGGANPLPQTLIIAATGSVLAFSVTSSTATGGAWLTVPDDGCCANTPNTVTAKVTASPTLQAGTYTGQIVIAQSNGAMSITVPVTLTVEPAGTAFFDNVQGQMSFSFTTASGNPPSQTVQIRNGGTGTLNWSASATTADGGNWLTLSAASGATPVGLSSTVTVGIVAASLPNQGLVAGTFVGELVFSTSGDIVTIPVSVVVGANVFVPLSPLTFTKAYAASNPVSQTLNIASTGSVFAFSVSSASATGGAWLSVPDDGCCANTPHVVTVAIAAAATLLPGTYTGQVVLAQSNGAMAMTVPIYLTVTNPLSISPASANVSGAGTGSTPNTISVTSTSPSVPWTAVSNASFIHVTGGTPGTGNGSVSYTVDANSSTSQQVGTITVAYQIFTVTEAAGGGSPPPVTVFSPAQGATGVSTSATLTWGAVAGATSYGVYFGATPTPPLVTTTSSTSYTPPTMNGNSTYYWFITSINAFGATQSALWSFTTGNPGSGGCSLTLSSLSVSLPPTGTSTVEVCPNGSGQPNCGVAPEHPLSFTVTPTAACGAWTATSSNPEFLAITSGTGGSGTGTVSYTVVNNTHNGAQNYSITVASGGTSQIFSITEVGSGDNQVYREVYALYEQLLGRDPDPAGFAFWTGSGGAGLGQMADSFLTSPEAYDTDFAVMATYQAATGNAPTFAQYNAAASAIRANTQTIPGLFNGLIGGSFSATNLYQNLLGRAPGAGDSSCIGTGLAACFQTIIGYPTNTTPVGDPNNEFQSTGTFHATDHTNGLYVQMVYYVTLSRDPDPAGLAFWTGIANGGGPGLLFQGNAGFVTRIQILGPGTPNQGFIGSPEFQGLFAN